MVYREAEGRAVGGCSGILRSEDERGYRDGVELDRCLLTLPSSGEKIRQRSETAVTASREQVVGDFGDDVGHGSSWLH